MSGRSSALTVERIDSTRTSIRSILGPTWERIAREDDKTRTVRNRHLLAVLDQTALDARSSLQAGTFPTDYSDVTVYLAIEGLLSRFTDEPSFRDVLPALADRRQFRHLMLTLGLADHLRLNSRLPVRLPPRSPTGERTVDLVFGGHGEFYVETKSTDEFDGPRRHVTGTTALRGIRRAWDRAYGGEPPQVAADVPSMLLIGGVAVQVSCMPVIQRRAARFLERKGRNLPKCWGILSMTFATASILPPGRRLGDGGSMTFTSTAGVQIAPARNPWYVGPPELSWRPGSWEE